MLIRAGHAGMGVQEGACGGEMLISCEDYALRESTYYWRIRVSKDF
jgi:hypothetical protein